MSFTRKKTGDLIKKSSKKNDEKYCFILGFSPGQFFSFAVRHARLQTLRYSPSYSLFRQRTSLSSFLLVFLLYIPLSFPISPSLPFSLFFLLCISLFFSCLFLSISLPPSVVFSFFLLFIESLLVFRSWDFSLYLSSVFLNLKLFPWFSFS